MVGPMINSITRQKNNVFNYASKTQNICFNHRSKFIYSEACYGINENVFIVVEKLGLALWCRLGARLITLGQEGRHDISRIQPLPNNYDY